jgi:ectoine hydroxylase-related dioxygenase (phytanoyl-CoA dioxygenase family)
MPGIMEPAQVAFFRQYGYLLYRQPVLPWPKFDALKQHFEAKLRVWEATSSKSPEYMDVPHFTDVKLFDWLFAEEVLDIVESLIGPDIALWSSHFICKPAGTGKRVPWHEDSAYWGTAVEPMEVVTLWLAIDRSTPENGCMRVIPNTQHGGYSEYESVDNPEQNVFDREIRRGCVDESRAVDCVLEPNQCSFHHARTIHGSNPNTSALRRCGYTMRYFPATAKFDAERRNRGNNNWLHQIYLARGRDRVGNAYGDPTRAHEAWRKASADQRRAVRTLNH